jgi:hypothetical protein
MSYKHPWSDVIMLPHPRHIVHEIAEKTPKNTCCVSSGQIQADTTIISAIKT